MQNENKTIFWLFHFYVALPERGMLILWLLKLFFQEIYSNIFRVYSCLVDRNISINIWQTGKSAGKYATLPN